MTGSIFAWLLAFWEIPFLGTAVQHSSQARQTLAWDLDGCISLSSAGWKAFCHFTLFERGKVNVPKEGCMGNVPEWKGAQSRPRCRPPVMEAASFLSHLTFRFVPSGWWPCALRCLLSIAALAAGSVPASPLGTAPHRVICIWAQNKNKTAASPPRFDSGANPGRPARSASPGARPGVGRPSAPRPRPRSGRGVPARARPPRPRAPCRPPHPRPTSLSPPEPRPQAGREARPGPSLRGCGAVRGIRPDGRGLVVARGGRCVVVAGARPGVKS